MNKNLRISLGLVFVLAPGLTHAAVVGDADAGKGKSLICAACHGTDGIGTAPENPNLAGQVPGYIADQLARFKSGQRANAIMLGMAAGLSEQNMADLDAYYSSLPAKRGAIPEDSVEAANRGAGLYRGGDQSMEIAACMGCHGPSGHGIPTRFPRVAGQKQTYLVNQLQAFKTGDRQSDGRIMNSIAFLLTRQQMENLAALMHAFQ
ncbi:MAG: Cytochrome c4 [Gammaproteobacteria bacterium]|nr:Cytochrome c4 [Gammaproteobacteria bacterium]